MAHKQVLFRSAAREKILRGATLLCDTVRVTLGPKSKSVLIQRQWGMPLVCNDGETIAKEFDLKDPEENLGAQMLRQAAEKTGDSVGDGTSTSTILAHAIFADGLRNVESNTGGFFGHGCGEPGRLTTFGCFYKNRISTLGHNRRAARHRPSWRVQGNCLRCKKDGFGQKLYRWHSNKR